MSITTWNSISSLEFIAIFINHVIPEISLTHVIHEFRAYIVYWTIVKLIGMNIVQ